MKAYTGSDHGEEMEEYWRLVREFPLVSIHDDTHLEDALDVVDRLRACLQSTKSPLQASRLAGYGIREIA